MGKSYLGCRLCRSVHTDDGTNASIANDSAAFGRFRTSVWERSGIRLNTKFSLQSSGTDNYVIVSETWTVY